MKIRVLKEQNVKLRAIIDIINEEKVVVLSVKLAKKVTILDVEEIPAGSDQGKIIQLKNRLSIAQEELQKMEGDYQWKVS